MSVRLLMALALGVAALTAPAGAHAATATVTLDVAGNGSGKVTSEPAGIDCTVVAGVEAGACSATFSSPVEIREVTVKLILKADPGSECRQRDAPERSSECRSTTTYQNGYSGFDRWDFIRAPQQLTVSKTGDGSGKVTSSPAGIDCGTTCTKSFDYDTKVTLTAAADAGAVFKQWTGACNGQGATCTLTITQATSTNAVFGLAGTTTPTTPTTDTAVEADVIGASAGKSRIGKRVVRLELILEEPVSAVLTLLRKGTTLATKRFASVKAGERVLTLTVPAGAAGGAARLRFELTDMAGNTLTGKRPVRIGKP